VSPLVGKGRGEEAEPDPPASAIFHAPPATAARGEDALPLSCSSGSLHDTVPVVQKVFLVNSILFWGYYCYFNVIFV
jgi:hypothetical protein